MTEGDAVGSRDGAAFAPSAQPGCEVFISYATPDAAVAESVCRALEQEDIRCWIAPRDVVPGEFYADAIVRAIDAAKILVVVLSQSAAESPHVLREVERAGSKRHSIVSLRTHPARLSASLEYFLNTSHWLDASVSGIEGALPKLVDAVRHLVGKEVGQKEAVAADARNIPESAAGARTSRWRWAAVAASAVVTVAVGYFVVAGHKISAPFAPAAAADPQSRAAAAFAPPAHSIAVLPFVNMSGDPSQDYFSDGLSEELLNSLTTIPDLLVAARTSSFTFKGKNEDVADIARKLNVSAVLEGSVRKEGNRVRITAQLINAVTGFHLWSHTYDRDLKDVLKLQTDIATAVTQALRATLMADAAATIELGGTQNPQAFDAYLHAMSLLRGNIDRNVALAIMDALDDAIRFDPNYAKAYASKALGAIGFAAFYAAGAQREQYIAAAKFAAQRAVELAPQLGEAHSARAIVLASGSSDFSGALAEHERALALSPNDSGVLMRAARFLAAIGRTDQAVPMARRGASLDQLNPQVYDSLAGTLREARLYPEALEAVSRAQSLIPKDRDLSVSRGVALLQLGEAEAARQACDIAPLTWQGRRCLAIAYEKLQRRSEAQAQVATMKAEQKDATAYQYAEIYAQWGETAQALDWLETAYRLRDPGIIAIRVDAFLDPLRAEPRFREIEAKLNLPH